MNRQKPKNNPLALPDKGRIVIIGGGPGGTSCALALNQFAKKQNKNIKITLVEGKEFSNKRHHNQCVGVLSPPLPDLLESTLDIPFPREICIGNIDRYILHSNGNEIKLNDHGEPSVAVRRIEFDAYMLEQVAKQDIDIIPARVVDLEFHPDNVIVYTENRSFEADVVVGAFGLDEGSATIFGRRTNYRPPLGLDSIVINYPITDNYLSNFGGSIHAFLPKNSNIEFGAVTPKCDHLTINIAGRKVDVSLMRLFLDMPEVDEILPEYGNDKNIHNTNSMIFYKGRFPRSLARGFYGERYVMIGDASGLVRAFKGKGATTAMITGIRAADTILNHGISRRAFHQHYRTANQDIIQDLPYGRSMRLATLMMSNFGLMGMVVRAAQRNDKLRSALFGAVSGHTAYKKIIGDVIHPKVIWSMIRALRK